MKRKSIFLDVDGTLVSGHATMNFKVVEAINRARQNGHYVFICTGRYLKYLMKIIYIIITNVQT